MTESQSRQRNPARWHPAGTDRGERFSGAVLVLTFLLSRQRSRHYPEERPVIG